jgi:iron(III) transport system permease protein
VLRRREQALLLGAAGAVLVVAALLPLLFLVAELPATTRTVLEVLGTGRPWELLLRSTVLAGIVAAAAVAAGVPLALLIARTNLPFRRMLWGLHLFPLFLPPFVLALGWFHLLGRTGLLGTEATAQLLFSEAGAIWVLWLTFTPVCTSLVALSLLGVDASLEEAARLVASPMRVATRILIPAARPAIVLSAILAFTLALSELAVPMFLRVSVFPAAVFARLGGIDYAPGEAFALALPLLPLALLLLALERRFVGPRSFAVAGLRGMTREPIALGAWRPVASVAVWLLVLLDLAPLLVLGFRAATGGGLTTLPRWLGQAPWNSLLSGAVAATVIAALGFVLGHAAARRIRGATGLDALSMLAFVTPAPVLGVGLIAVWNRSWSQVVYGSLAILVVGFIARYTVVALRTVSSVVLQSPRDLEDAAATAGAGAWRRLGRIVLPLNARGVAAGWLLAFLFCVRDLETAVLFYPAGREPLTVRIFTLEANGPPAVVAGLAVAQIALTAAVLGLGALAFSSRRIVR